MNIIEVKQLSRIYGKGNTEVRALNGVDFVVGNGEFVALMGPSGSGKSTLLNLLGCLDKPTNGTYLLERKEVAKNTNPKTLAQIRREKIGFIFQTFNLLARTSALENVMLPAIYSGLKNRKKKAMGLLKKVGLSKRIHHKTNQLSGGEQQRVAIARALMNNPKIILADEPTGNLDSKSGVEIMKILRQLNREGTTIIAVTHDQEIAKVAERVVKMKDGRIV